MTSMDSVPRLNPNVGVQRVGGRLLAAGPEDSLHSFEDGVGGASEVAERIVELVDGKRSVREIATAIGEEFEVSRDVCEADTRRFVEGLVEKKVLLLAE